jgi:hypothetical protein
VSKSCFGKRRIKIQKCHPSPKLSSRVVVVVVVVVVVAFSLSAFVVVPGWRIESDDRDSRALFSHRTFANPPIRFNNRSDAHTRSHANDASSSVTAPLLCSFSPFLLFLVSLFLNTDLTTKSAPAPAAGAPTKYGFTIVRWRSV